ncbi:FRIGIDA-like protein 4a [Lactuca sativa]|uniref:FRIGIDA-like protein n=1 Tax=Lactuca sativa TaxID=4236 RepID=A0A9R1V6Y5_LACSA|nr:FRIGIDA-like protein 4a [Lactuca sativa]KAJ0200039.1 hypothetical protein LSAT_V11C600324990 [Lactuca sativa]
MTKDYVINPDRFKNFFNELDTRRTLLTNVTDLNNKLVNHFISLEETLNQKSVTLDTQIEKFKKDTEKTLESLQVRESALPEKEVTLAARVQQLKDSGIKDIENGASSHGKKKRMSELLRMWFRRMDSKGLMEYLLANRKKYEVLRMETAMASEEAIDLLAFVLEAVEDYLELKISGKFGGLAPTRCACGILIQAAFPIPSGGEPFCLSHGGGGVSSKLKERAAMVMEKWKTVLGSGGSVPGYREDIVASGEAILFLTMVMGFGLKDRFDDEFLKSLMLEVGNRKDMAKLAMALGFGGKEIIEELVNTGKEVEAVYIASEAGLSDLFPPLTLLKSCYANCQKTFTKDSPSREEIFNESKITREIIKCIEDHKLESEFRMSTMRKRVAHLERTKAEMKTATAAATRCSQSPARKRSRSPHHHNHQHHHRRFDFDASPSPRAPKSGRVSSTFTAFHRQSRPQLPTHQPAAARYPVAAATAAPYSYSSPSVYESDPYAVGYGAVHTESHAGYGQYAGQDAVQAGGSYVSQDGAASGSYSYDYSSPAVATEAATSYPAT